MIKSNDLGFKNNVSLMGFGGIPIMTRISETKYLSQFTVSKDNENYSKSINTIKRAVEMGVNFFDTARDYGDSEKKIGEAIHDRRSEVTLASKSKALTYDEMMYSVESSLDNLKTDYLDLYQCHYVKDRISYSKIINKDGAYEALEKLKNQNVIKKIGIASHNRFVLIDALKENFFDTIQLPYNIIENENVDIIKLAQESNIPTIIMKPFAGGSLTKINSNLLGIINDDEKLRELAIKFILQQNVSVVIPGVSSINELEDNYRIFNKHTELNRDDIEIIEIIKNKIGKIFCRRCQYCEPCPQKIPIAEILRLFKYYNDYELKDWSKKQYHDLIPKADICKKCGCCERKCPYKLEISDELEKIHLILGGKNDA